MFTFLFNAVTRSIVVLLVAVLSVNYIPDSLFKDFPLDPKIIASIDYDSVIPKEWNTKLSDGKPEFIQLNNIDGPESIAISKNGLIYTGLADGRIVELDPSQKYKVRTVSRAVSGNPKCKDNVATLANECGRFLQVRMVNETLYSVEANSGLYKINVKDGTKTFLGPKKLHKVNLFNSFAFDPTEPNLVYLSISSTRWDLLNIMWSFIDGDSSGQLIALDIKTGKRVVILDKLATSNGIDVDTKRNQLLLAETVKSRIISIALDDIRAAFKSTQDGAKATIVATRAIIPLLPGLPDNIIIEGDIAYIALPFVRQKGKELIDHLAGMPNVRKAIGRFTYSVGLLSEYINNNIYHHPLLETVYRELKCGHVNYRATQTDISAVLVYNLSTGASRLFGSSTFGFVSEAVPDGKGNLLLGSFRSPFIVKQKISDFTVASPFTSE